VDQTTVHKKTGICRSSSGAINGALLVALAVVAIVAIGFGPRMVNISELAKVHEQQKDILPVVLGIVIPQASKNTSLRLPGDLQPIQNIPIFARANGFLRQRFVDIGDEVKTGELLAIIDTPELDQQVEQAAANLSAAQANLAAALSDRENYAALLFAADSTIKQTRTNLEYSATEVTRYQNLATQGAVSFEQRDQQLKQYNSDKAGIEIASHNRQAQLAQVASANARIASAKQAIVANQAAYNQLRALQGFQKVFAPCDGVITDRMVDAGSLVAAGGSSGTTQLLLMAKTDVLRIYVDVPQADYRFIHNNDKAELVLQEFPAHVFAATVTNIAGGLNSSSRTLQTELRIDNHKHELKPGAYAEVQFNYTNPNPAVNIPSNASITKNDGLYVAIVADGKLSYRPVEVGRDLGSTLEITKGIKAGEVVVLDAPDGLAEGAKVKVKVMPPKMVTAASPPAAAPVDSKSADLGRDTSSIPARTAAAVPVHVRAY
jgi:RND family efflux transporter MFP subunit